MSDTQERSSEIASLLSAAGRGDKAAFDLLFAIAYDELRRIARQARRGMPGTLTTTALVHEAYLKLLPADVTANDMAHLQLLIGRAMRHVLIDAARRQLATKRGGGAPHVTFDPASRGAPLQPDEVIRLNDALTELELVDPRRAAVVNCRFFAGLDVEDTAAALNVSTATVKRDWRLARAWLADAVR